MHRYRQFGSRLAGPPDPGAAVGGRGHRLAGPGPARRRRHRSGRQAPGQAAVPGVGAVRGQRDGRGLDVGGPGQGRLLQARQPDRDRRREPAGPARPDRAGVGHWTPTPRRAEAFGCTAVVIDGHDLDRDRRRPWPTARDAGAADRDPGPDRSRAGASPRSRTRTAGTASRCPPTWPSGRSPSSAASGTCASPRPAPEPSRRPAASEAAAASPCRGTRSADKVATRKAYGDALAALGARPEVVALDGEVGNSTYAERVRQGLPGPVTSRCSSPSSS